MIFGPGSCRNDGSGTFHEGPYETASMAAGSAGVGNIRPSNSISPSGSMAERGTTARTVAVS